MVRTSALVVAALLVVLAGCGGAGDVRTAGVTDSETSRPAASATAGGDSTPHPSTAPRVRVTVVDVVDADTVDVRYPNGSRETVRLLGVDSPETRAESAPGEFEGVPDTDAGRRCLRRAGEEASEMARTRLAGETVGLGFDPRSDRRGGYGRLLAYVYVDGEQFNHRLLVAGHARLYDSPLVERARYAAAEQRARATDRGLWACATDG